MSFVLQTVSQSYLFKHAFQSGKVTRQCSEKHIEFTLWHLHGEITIPFYSWDLMAQLQLWKEVECLHVWW